MSICSSKCLYIDIKKLSIKKYNIMLGRIQMKIPTKDLFERWTLLNELYWKNSCEILAKYPKGPDGMDLRAALFGLPGNALVGYGIAMAMIETVLTDRRWWETFTPYRTESEITERLGHYDNSIRQGYFILFFSRIEWIIRNMLFTLDSSLCDGGLGPFKNVYEAFLNQINCNDLLIIFELSRHLRNSMHNNGIYMNKQRNDSQIYSYRGLSIQFKHNKSIENATPLSFDLYEDLILACRKIVDSTRISAIVRMPFVLGSVID